MQKVFLAAVFLVYFVNLFMLGVINSFKATFQSSITGGSDNQGLAWHIFHAGKADGLTGMVTRNQSSNEQKTGDGDRK